MRSYVQNTDFLSMLGFDSGDELRHSVPVRCKSTQQACMTLTLQSTILFHITSRGIHCVYISTIFLLTFRHEIAILKCVNLCLKRRLREEGKHEMSVCAVHPKVHEAATCPGCRRRQ